MTDTAYWPRNTDSGTGNRYFVAALAGGRYAVEDGDSDVGTPPFAVFDSRAAARACCRRQNDLCCTKKE
jgi:hypothetical protein